MHVIVIGAGAVGAATALALCERGLRVTLLDQAPDAGEGTSHANGGGITPGHAEPWNPPGTIRRLLPGTHRRDPSSKIYAAAVPGMFGWGLKFLLNSRPSRYFDNAANSFRLAVYSGQVLRAWRERFELDYAAWTRGSLEVYFSREALDHSRGIRERINNPDVKMQPVDAAECTRLEPELEPVAGEIVGGLFFPEHESGDAWLFSRAAARLAHARGAQVLFSTSVSSIETRSGQFTGVTTDAGQTIGADACVVAAGCDSPVLMRPLGLDLPIQPVKGYSATLALSENDPAPAMPLLDLGRRIVTARFGDRLRIAGMADFAGHDREPTPERMKYLLDTAARLLPRLAHRLRTEELEPWAGLRPMTPDGPPLLGPAGIDGLYLNTGHGSMGWTQACGSAEILADLVIGREPAIALKGLAPEGRIRRR